MYVELYIKLLSYFNRISRLYKNEKWSKWKKNSHSSNYEATTSNKPLTELKETW